MESPLPIPERIETLMDRGTPEMDTHEPDRRIESVAVTGAAVAAGIATRRGLQTLWKQWRGTEPPEDPAAPGVTWPDALIWAMAVGAAVGVARVLSRRGTTAAVGRFR